MLGPNLGAECLKSPVNISSEKKCLMDTIFKEMSVYARSTSIGLSIIDLDKFAQKVAKCNQGTSRKCWENE